MKPRIFPLFASTARHFRSSSTIVLTCASLVGGAASSQAGVLWSDNFNSYANGGLAHQAGGGAGTPGWGANNWFSADGTVNVTAGVVNGNGNVRHGLTQTFAATVGATGTIWLSFDWGHDSENTTGTYGGLTFIADAGERALIGNTWNATTWNVTNPGANTAPTSIGMKTAVAKITLGAGELDDTIDLWVGSTGSPVDVSGAAMVTGTGLELGDVNLIRIMGNNAQTFDNLVIGTDVTDVNATTTPPPIASGTWTNTAGGPWGTEANWSGDTVASGSDSTAYFNTLDITADTTVTLDSARTIGNLIFGDTDTLTAAGWTLTGNNLTLAGTTPTITVNALGDTKTATISSAVGGAAGLTKAGTGTLTLSAANTYSGTTTVSEGTLLVSGQSYFNVGRTTTVASGAVFELNNSNNTFTSLMPVSSITGAGTFRLSGNSTINQDLNGNVETRLSIDMDAGGLIDLQGTSRLTNGGWQEMNWTSNLADMNIASGATLDIWDGQDVIIDALTGSGTVDKLHTGNSPRLLKVGVDNGSGTFSGTITNAAGGQLALVKAGSGSQTLSGTNSYSGNTTVEDGTLSIPSGGSLRFFPTTNGQTNALSGTASATLSYLGTVDLDLSATEIIDGNFWTLVDLGSFSGPVPTLTPAAVTSTLGAFSETTPGTWERLVTGAKWTFTEDDGTLLYEVTATPYEIWANSFDPDIGLPAEDDDNDGVTNFEEYAFGLLPNSGASANPIASTLNKTNGKFSYTRRTGSGLTYSVWFSENLADWIEDTGATEDTPVPSGDNETVEVTLSTLPGDPLPAKLFIQVRADEILP